MRAVILGDIHGNLEAFTAVLDDARAHGGFDELWCLGDTVGYGPDPRACLDLLKSLPGHAIAGNHDKAVIGKLSIEDFNGDAGTAVAWTQRELSRDYHDQLRALPVTVINGLFTMVHGSLREPLWEYLLSPAEALPTFALLRTQVCLIGHSHIPFVCREVRAEGETDAQFTHPLPIGIELRLGKERWIVNPGGVGQPRDGDPRASYIVYDSARETFEHRRVTYDIATTQMKMKRAGLPVGLGTRLAEGR